MLAELYSEKCKIPRRFRLYHAGRGIDGFLKAKEGSIYSKLSSHIYFSANMASIQQEYLGDFLIDNPKYRDDKEIDRYRERELFVIDARKVPFDAYVLVNKIGWWYDKLRCIDEIIQDMENNKVNGIAELIRKNPDFLLEGSYRARYLEKFPNLKSKEDFRKRFEEERQEWFSKYCRIFNFLHMERYSKDNDNVILVLGPIPIKV